MNIKNKAKITLTLALMAVAIFAASASAATTMTASATAPAVDNLDVANYGTVTGTDKWWAEDSGAGSAKGQTFTTGSDRPKLNAITYQVADTQQAEPTKTYVVRVGTVSGTSFTEIHSETFTQDFTWNSSEYMTWTFDTPVLLSADTEYGIDIGMTSSTSAWQTGIPYINMTADGYADGLRYTSGTLGFGTDTLSLDSSRDRIFHIDMSLGDPNLPTIDDVNDVITWSGQAVTLNMTVTNNDANDPGNPRPVTLLWSVDAVSAADTNLTILTTDDTLPSITVTVTKTAPTTTATEVTMTLTATLEDEPEDVGTVDRGVKIYVYDNACEAAKAAGAVAYDNTDITGEDCITNLLDYAKLAEDWLIDYNISGPMPKP